MVEWIVKPEESGGRMDKYLKQRLKNAPDSFFYKMARKKNLVLNGKKCTAKEILNAGDKINLYVSDDTIALFSGNSGSEINHISEYRNAFEKLKGITVIYEDSDLLFLYKPAGILSQKADSETLSLNEWMIGYLLDKNIVSVDSLKVFHPSVLNRLDRNTSGIVIAGITPRGSRFGTKMIRERAVRKFYHCITEGICELNGCFEGYLIKNRESNISSFYLTLEEIPEKNRKAADKVSLSAKPLENKCGHTLMEIELHTGKSHQIRSMLSTLGSPIAVDPKYGNSKNAFGQLLCAVRIEFPDRMEEEDFASYQSKIIECKAPFSLDDFR